MDILKSFAHPDEVYALFRYKFGGCEAVMPKSNQVNQISKENSSWHTTTPTLSLSLSLARSLCVDRHSLSFSAELNNTVK